MAMSDEHKAALAQGRKESRAVKSYLEALSSKKPGRPVTPDSIRQKIESLEEKIGTEPDPLKRLEYRQSRLDAEDALESAEASENLDELEAEFISVAKSYSDRKGLNYSVWRDEGVPAKVLKEAGIPRTRRA